MITPLTIYIWQLCDKVIHASSAITVVLSVIFIIAQIVLIAADDIGSIDSKEHKILSKRWAKYLGFPIIACVLISVFTPSSNTVAMMVIIPEVANSKIIQQDIPDLYNAAIEALKKEIKQ